MAWFVRGIRGCNGQPGNYVLFVAILCLCYGTNMTVYVVRHSAPNFETGTLGYYAHLNVPQPGSPDELSEMGMHNAASLATKLMGKGLFVDGSDVLAAVSEHSLTRQTALHAGFHYDEQVEHALLNEVELPDMTHDELAEVLRRDELPNLVLERAQQLIEDPPEQGVWFTHGLVVAGLTKVLDVRHQRLLVPNYGEIRALPLN